MTPGRADLPHSCRHLPTPKKMTKHLLEPKVAVCKPCSTPQFAAILNTGNCTAVILHILQGRILAASGVPKHQTLPKASVKSRMQLAQPHSAETRPWVLVTQGAILHAPHSTRLNREHFSSTCKFNKKYPGDQQRASVEDGR